MAEKTDKEKFEEWLKTATVEEIEDALAKLLLEEPQEPGMEFVEPADIKLVRDELKERRKIPAFEKPLVWGPASPKGEIVPLQIVKAEDISEAASVKRLQELRRLLDWMGYRTLANTGNRVYMIWDEVKRFLVKDKDPKKLENQSFLTTLKRLLQRLEEEGYPEIEVHQIKQLAYPDKTGKRIPKYLIEFEFVKPRDAEPLNFTLISPPKGGKGEEPKETAKAPEKTPEVTPGMTPEVT